MRLEPAHPANQLQSIFKYQNLCDDLQRERAQKAIAECLVTKITEIYTHAVSTDQINQLIKRSTESCIAKATRRLIFTHTSVPLEESGTYHADMVYSRGGTGILIKFQNIFFLLTAQHVIDENYSEPQNEAPFFTTASSNPAILTEEEILWPMRGWRIGELISLDLPGIDTEDIVLIELSSLLLTHPDRYIDLDDGHPTPTLDYSYLFESMLACCSGFPLEKNPIEYDFDANPQCRATFHRHHIVARWEPENSGWIARTINPLGHEQMNGLSGGAVCNVHFETEPVRWVGMMQKGGNGIIRIYPADAIKAAIRRFRQASYYIIDPAAHLSCLEIESSDEAMQARGYLLKAIKNRSKA